MVEMPTTDAIDGDVSVHLQSVFQVRSKVNELTSRLQSCLDHLQAVAVHEGTNDEAPKQWASSISNPLFADSATSSFTSDRGRSAPGGLELRSGSASWKPLPSAAPAHMAHATRLHALHTHASSNTDSQARESVTDHHKHATASMEQGVAHGAIDEAQQLLEEMIGQSSPAAQRTILESLAATVPAPNSGRQSLAADPRLATFHARSPGQPQDGMENLPKHVGWRIKHKALGYRVLIHPSENTSAASTPVPGSLLNTAVPGTLRMPTDLGSSSPQPFSPQNFGHAQPSFEGATTSSAAGTQGNNSNAASTRVSASGFSIQGVVDARAAADNTPSSPGASSMSSALQSTRTGQTALAPSRRQGDSVASETGAPGPSHVQQPQLPPRSSAHGGISAARQALLPGQQKSDAEMARSRIEAAAAAAIAAVSAQVAQQAASAVPGDLDKSQSSRTLRPQLTMPSQQSMEERAANSGGLIPMILTVVRENLRQKGLINLSSLQMGQLQPTGPHAASSDKAAAAGGASTSAAAAPSDGGATSGEAPNLLRRSLSDRKDRDSTALHRILKRVSTINSRRRMSTEGVNLAAALALDDDDDAMVPIPEPAEYTTSTQSSEEDEPPGGSGGTNEDSDEGSIIIGVPMDGSAEADILDERNKRAHHGGPADVLMNKHAQKLERMVSLVRNRRMSTRRHHAARRHESSSRMKGDDSGKDLASQDTAASPKSSAAPGTHPLRSMPAPGRGTVSSFGSTSAQLPALAQQQVEELTTTDVPSSEDVLLPPPASNARAGLPRTDARTSTTGLASNSGSELEHDARRAHMTQPAGSPSKMDASTSMGGAARHAAPVAQPRRTTTDVPLAARTAKDFFAPAPAPVSHHYYNEDASASAGLDVRLACQFFQGASPGVAPKPEMPCIPTPPKPISWPSPPPKAPAPRTAHTVQTPRQQATASTPPPVTPVDEPHHSEVFRFSPRQELQPAPAQSPIPPDLLQVLQYMVQLTSTPGGAELAGSLAGLLQTVLVKEQPIAGGTQRSQRTTRMTGSPQPTPRTTQDLSAGGASIHTGAMQSGRTTTSTAAGAVSTGGATGMSSMGGASYAPSQALFGSSPSQGGAAIGLLQAIEGGSTEAGAGRATHTSSTAGSTQLPHDSVCVRPAWRSSGGATDGGASGITDLLDSLIGTAQRQRSTVDSMCDTVEEARMGHSTGGSVRSELADGCSRRDSVRSTVEGAPSLATNSTVSRAPDTVSGAVSTVLSARTMAVTSSDGGTSQQLRTTMDTSSYRVTRESTQGAPSFTTASDGGTSRVPRMTVDTAGYRATMESVPSGAGVYTSAPTSDGGVMTSDGGMSSSISLYPASTARGTLDSAVYPATTARGIVDSSLSHRGTMASAGGAASVQSVDHDEPAFEEAQEQAWWQHQIMMHALAEQQQLQHTLPRVSNMSLGSLPPALTAAGSVASASAGGATAGTSVHGAEVRERVTQRSILDFNDSDAPPLGTAASQRTTQHTQLDFNDRDTVPLSASQRTTQHTMLDFTDRDARTTTLSSLSYGGAGSEVEVEQVGGVASSTRTSLDSLAQTIQDLQNMLAAQQQPGAGAPTRSSVAPAYSAPGGMPQPHVTHQAAGLLSDAGAARSASPRAAAAIAEARTQRALQRLVEQAGGPAVTQSPRFTATQSPRTTAGGMYRSPRASGTGQRTPANKTPRTSAQSPRSTTQQTRSRPSIGPPSLTGSAPVSKRASSVGSVPHPQGGTTAASSAASLPHSRAGSIMQSRGGSAIPSQGGSTLPDSVLYGPSATATPTQRSARTTANDPASRRATRGATTDEPPQDPTCAASPLYTVELDSEERQEAVHATALLALDDARSDSSEDDGLMASMDEPPTFATMDLEAADAEEALGPIDALAGWAENLRHPHAAAGNTEPLLATELVAELRRRSQQQQETRVDATDLRARAAVTTPGRVHDVRLSALPLVVDDQLAQQAVPNPAAAATMARMARSMTQPSAAPASPYKLLPRSGTTQPGGVNTSPLPALPQQAVTSEPSLEDLVAAVTSGQPSIAGSTADASPALMALLERLSRSTTQPSAPSHMVAELPMRHGMTQLGGPHLPALPLVAVSEVGPEPSLGSVSLADSSTRSSSVNPTMAAPGARTMVSVSTPGMGHGAAHAQHNVLQSLFSASMPGSQPSTSLASHETGAIEAAVRALMRMSVEDGQDGSGSNTGDGRPAAVLPDAVMSMVVSALRAGSVPGDSRSDDTVPLGPPRLNASSPGTLPAPWHTPSTATLGSTSVLSAACGSVAADDSVPARTRTTRTPSATMQAAGQEISRLHDTLVSLVSQVVGGPANDILSAATANARSGQHAVTNPGTAPAAGQVQFLSTAGAHAATSLPTGSPASSTSPGRALMAVIAARSAELPTALSDLVDRIVRSVSAPGEASQLQARDGATSMSMPGGAASDKRVPRVHSCDGSIADGSTAAAPSADSSVYDDEEHEAEDPGVSISAQSSFTDGQRPMSADPELRDALVSCVAVCMLRCAVAEAREELQELQAHAAAGQLQYELRDSLGGADSRALATLSHRPPPSTVEELDELRKHALQSAMSHLNVLRSRSLLHNAFMVWRGRVLAAKSRNASPSQSHERTTSSAIAAAALPSLVTSSSVQPVQTTPHRSAGCVAAQALASARHTPTITSASASTTATTAAVAPASAVYQLGSSSSSSRAHSSLGAAMAPPAPLLDSDTAVHVGLDVLDRVKPMQVMPRMRSRTVAAEPMPPVSPSLLMAAAAGGRAAAVFRPADAPARPRAASLPAGTPSSPVPVPVGCRDADVGVRAVITAMQPAAQARPASRPTSAHRTRSGKGSKRPADGQPQGGGMLDALEAVDALLDSCFSPRADASPAPDNERAPGMLNRTAGGSRMATSPRSLLGARSAHGSVSGPGAPPQRRHM